MANRIADHYERHADAFDEARRAASFVEREWLDRFLVDVPIGAHVLDLGCGAGDPIARYLIESGRKVTGVDVSKRMIELAQTRFPAERWLCMDMREATMDVRFQGVVAWDSLFHLHHEAQTSVLTKIASWLEPSGMLLFNTGPDRGESVGNQFGDPLYHASLAPAEYRTLFDQLNLIEIAFAPTDPNTGERSVWLAKKKPASH
jgi:2-polyprenyl-3-methyl-5-hydroxy-6-metoxy-1,4-benzoquinol methylase